ncbi:kinase-like domain-containing protein [Rhizophagus clarus]|uniref:Kinase-like domain-containing protein n=1 Tax=Rhizophagus clarus TaxID=94130 RepID=A0A8H3M1H5_9GLOM|nr:kinase-like domain-containing protein [Rhizophagus clarus]
MQRFGKSDNIILDKFIEEKKLKWIPYNQLEYVEYLDKGGFGIVYVAIWKKRLVALKCLNNLNENNLNENLNEFLNEWDCHEKCLSSTRIINLHGFTKNPYNSNYMYGIYGVVPFMAPEVLRGNPYTTASDIYSFSIIMWEFTSGIPPFNNRAHDLQLSLSICKGERPEIIENTPQCYVDLMKKCWNEDPLKRPFTSNVKNIIENWIYYPSNNIINEELESNIMEFINAPIGNNNLVIEPHPQACYTSRLLDFTSKKLNEILESECLDCLVNNIESLDNKTNEN